MTSNLQFLKYLDISIANLRIVKIVTYNCKLLKKKLEVCRRQNQLALSLRFHFSEWLSHYLTLTSLGLKTEKIVFGMLEVQDKCDLLVGFVE